MLCDTVSMGTRAGSRVPLMALECLGSHYRVFPLSSPFPAHLSHLSQYIDYAQCMHYNALLLPALPYSLIIARRSVRFINGINSCLERPAKASSLNDLLYSFSSRTLPCFLCATPGRRSQHLDPSFHDHRHRLRKEADSKARLISPLGVGVDRERRVYIYLSFLGEAGTTILRHYSTRP